MSERNAFHVLGDRVRDNVPLKPITWFAPMWALACGVVSSGQPVLDRWPFVLGAVLHGDKWGFHS